MKEVKKVVLDEMIQNINLERLPNGDSVFHFSMEGCYYSMQVEEETLETYLIHHRDYEDTKNCPFCTGILNFCSVLTKQKEEIFAYLTQHPAIRLRWLFKQY